MGGIERRSCRATCRTQTSRAGIRRSRRLDWRRPRLVSVFDCRNGRRRGSCPFHRCAETLGARNVSAEAPCKVVIPQEERIKQPATHCNHAGTPPLPCPKYSSALPTRGIERACQDSRPARHRRSPRRWNDAQSSRLTLADRIYTCSLRSQFGSRSQCRGKSGALGRKPTFAIPGPPSGRRVNNACRRIDTHRRPTRVGDVSSHDAGTDVQSGSPAA